MPEALLNEGILKAWQQTWSNVSLPATSYTSHSSTEAQFERRGALHATSRPVMPFSQNVHNGDVEIKHTKKVPDTARTT